MAATGFLREDFVEGDPVRKVCSATQARRIARILNSIEGVGCIVERCYSQEGFGWRIVVPESPYQAKPDTSGYDATKDPDGRRTLEKNLEDYSGDPNSHKNEWQLRNVNLTKKGSASIPFFLSEDPLQGTVPDKVVGELYWATLDANRVADNAEKVYRSLAAADTHTTISKGKYSLSLYGFTACNVSSVPYAKEVTNPAGSGRELDWRYPVTWESAPQNTVPASDNFILNISEGSATGSYATLMLYTRSLTVDRGALNIGAASAQITAYVPITIDPEDIDPTPSSEIIHNETDGQNLPGYATWTATNNGHDGRYLRIGAGWTVPGGESYSNICNGIANAADGTRAVDFANGLIYGDDFSEGEKIDFGDQKLYAYNGSKKETLDWKSRKLTAESASSPWTATRAFRITADGDPTKWVDFVVGSGTLEIKDQDGEQLALFEKA
jgi:hypothetical protein